MGILTLVAAMLGFTGGKKSGPFRRKMARGQSISSSQVVVKTQKEYNKNGQESSE